MRRCWRCGVRRADGTAVSPRSGRRGQATCAAMESIAAISFRKRRPTRSSSNCSRSSQADLAQRPQCYKGRTPPARGELNMAGPNLETYFKNIIVLNQAFSEEGQQFRDSHAQANVGAADDRAVLWLGCNVLRTPHLAQLATKVMRILNPELSVLGGPSHCCGSPMTEKGDRERALEKSIGHFQAEQAPTLVSWCPSCHTNLRKGSDASSWGFEELHITEFIARHLDRMRLHPRLSAR